MKSRQMILIKDNNYTCDRRRRRRHRFPLMLLLLLLLLLVLSVCIPTRASSSSSGAHSYHRRHPWVGGGDDNGNNNGLYHKFSNNNNRQKGRHNNNSNSKNHHLVVLPSSLISLSRRRGRREWRNNGRNAAAAAAAAPEDSSWWTKTIATKQQPYRCFSSSTWKELRAGAASPPTPNSGRVSFSSFGGDNYYLGGSGGGDDTSSGNMCFHVAKAMIQGVSLCLKTFLPPLVGLARGTILFYRALPTDVLLAQAGLVYCFAGGYYPTLFASVQAAQQCGWNTMCHAIDDLATEAVVAVQAMEDEKEFYNNIDKKKETTITATQVFRQQTMVVLASVDPVKINQALAALYTTWMGVSSVLQREFARTVTLSMTIARYMQIPCEFLLGPVLRFGISRPYHRWVPVLIEWSCKAASMSIAWRIQRVLSATASAITGGLLFSRSLLRLLGKKFSSGKSKRRRRRRRGDSGGGGGGGIHFYYHGFNKKKQKPSSRENNNELEKEQEDANVEEPQPQQELQELHFWSIVEQLFGFLVAGLGLCSQLGIGSSAGIRFDFKMPFPLNLVLWPFDWIERWIQWQITKESTS